ncbi:MAG: endolytic transglycosylase MltG [Bacillota bacterium]
MRRKKRKIGLFSLLLVMFIIFWGGKAYYSNQIQPVNKSGNKEIFIDIPKGASTSVIAHILKENDLIRNELAFRISSKLMKSDGKMKAGKYLLSDNMTVNEMIDILVDGKVLKDTVRVTIPEGFEFRQIVDRLSAKGLIDHDKFIEVADSYDFDYRFLEGIPKGKNRLEGFLFPDTYEIPNSADEKAIIDLMLKRFDDVFKEKYYQRADELNMSIHEVITLASIIEREAKLEKERPIISSVFHNRLNKGMLLQSCATVQYILGERKQNLTLKDIAIDSPFNTYKNIGLPPTPIASPGKLSIEAALYPEDTEYLYFVLKKDGEHAFSKTYDEHLRAKNGN